MDNDMPLSRAGRLIDAARAKAGLSTREAARRAGISEGRWRQVVKGSYRAGGQDISTKTKPETLAAMARAVGADVDEVFESASLPAPERRGSSYVYDRTQPGGPLHEIWTDETIPPAVQQAAEELTRAIAQALMEKMNRSDETH